MYIYGPITSYNAMIYITTYISGSVVSITAPSRDVIVVSAETAF